MARPRYTPADRMLLATLARLLPRKRWGTSTLDCSSPSHAIAALEAECHRQVCNATTTLRRANQPTLRSPEILLGPASLRTPRSIREL